MKARALLVRAGLALLATTGGLLALGVGGLVLLTTDAGNDWARDLIVAHAPVPRGTLTIEELRFNLLSQLSLRGVSLCDEAGRELVGFDALTLRYGLGGLLERQLLVSELRLERPRLDANVGQDGALDLLVALGLDGPSPEEPASGPWSGLPGRLDLGALTIIDADIRYRDQGLDLHLRELDLETRGMAAGRVVRLDTLSLSGQLASPGDRAIALDGALALLAEGIASTLAPENRRALRAIGDDGGWAGRPELDLLVDPQTSGGLLAAIPADRAEAALAALRGLGETAAVVGTVTAETDPACPLSLAPAPTRA